MTLQTLAAYEEEGVMEVWMTPHIMEDMFVLLSYFEGLGCVLLRRQPVACPLWDAIIKDIPNISPQTSSQDG